MTDEQALVKTLDFQLDIQSDNESLLYDACLEARRVYNETIRLAKDGVDWDAIPGRVADDANLGLTHGKPRGLTPRRFTHGATPLSTTRPSPTAARPSSR